MWGYALPHSGGALLPSPGADGEGLGRLDSLAVDATADLFLVFNSGDPTFRERGHGQSRHVISAGEYLFLRLVSCLAFVDVIAIPVRFIVHSADLMDAMKLAAPLLQLGLICPERRASAASYEEIAMARGIEDHKRQRAAFLDEMVTRPRLFHTEALQPYYKDVLGVDLAPGGLFRTVVPGGRQGAAAFELDKATRQYEERAVGLPGDFVEAVGSFLASAQRVARRWSMARFHTLPGAFDKKNLREIPRSAAALLIHAGEGKVVLPRLPPADAFFHDIVVEVRNLGVRANAERYCDAIVSLRQHLPQARRLTREILTTPEVAAMGADITAAFERELRRQRISHGACLSMSTALARGSMVAGRLFPGLPEHEAVRGVDFPWVVAGDGLLGLLVERSNVDTHVARR